MRRGRPEPAFAGSTAGSVAGEPGNPVQVRTTQTDPLGAGTIAADQLDRRLGDPAGLGKKAQERGVGLAVHRRRSQTDQRTIGAQ